MSTVLPCPDGCGQFLVSDVFGMTPHMPRMAMGTVMPGTVRYLRCPWSNRGSGDVLVALIRVEQAPA